MTKTTEKKLTVRVMSRNDVDLAIDWAANEGWNPGLTDAEIFYNTDPNGFFIGEVNGDPVGCISVVAYGESFGFLGLYIVKPKYRGKGFGLQIWKKSLEYLGDRNVGLDGVVDQQQNYKKSGFKFSYNNIRYGGTISCALPIGVVPLSAVPFKKIEAYDARLFPAPRTAFLRQWIEQPNGKGFTVMNNDKPLGYGLIRECRTGFKIGPLFADNREVAEMLFLALCSTASGAPILFDTPEPNADAVELAEHYNMKLVFETARMYTKEQPDIVLSKVFGVTTLELG